MYSPEREATWEIHEAGGPTWGVDCANEAMELRVSRVIKATNQQQLPGEIWFNKRGPISFCFLWFVSIVYYEATSCLQLLGWDAQFVPRGTGSQTLTAGDQTGAVILIVLWRLAWLSFDAQLRVAGRWSLVETVEAKLFD